jgi:hypothetical protein
VADASGVSFALEFDFDLDCVGVGGGGDLERNGLCCLAVVSLRDLGDHDVCGDLGFDPNLLRGNALEF